MKITLLFLFFACVAFAQTHVQVVKPQSLRLNPKVGELIGGSSRNYVTVQLPPRTVSWGYGICAKRTREELDDTKQKMNLLGQLSKLVDASGTAALAINTLSTPQGDDFCEVYLLGSSNDISPFINHSNFNQKNIGYRNNIKNGIVDINESAKWGRTEYIGINNSSVLHGLTITIEVIAYVSEGWAPDEKQKGFEAAFEIIAKIPALSHVSIDEKKSLTYCFMSTLSEKYNPADLQKLAPYEQEEISKKYIMKCLLELDIKPPPIKQESNSMGGMGETATTNEIDIKTITSNYFIGTWEDENSKFTFTADGKFSITWSNGQKLENRNWEFKDQKLYMTFNTKFFTEHDVSSLGENSFKYKASGDDTIYNAKRVFN